MTKGTDGFGETQKPNGPNAWRWTTARSRFYETPTQRLDRLAAASPWSVYIHDDDRRWLIEQVQRAWAAYPDLASGGIRGTAKGAESDGD